MNGPECLQDLEAATTAALNALLEELPVLLQKVWGIGEQACGKAGGLFRGQLMALRILLQYILSLNIHHSILPHLVSISFGSDPRRPICRTLEYFSLHCSLIWQIPAASYLPHTVISTSSHQLGISAHCRHPIPVPVEENYVIWGFILFDSLLRDHSSRMLNFQISKKSIPIYFV